MSWRHGAFVVLLQGVAALAGAEEQPSFRFRLAFYAVPALVDGVSTELAIATGGREANPFLGRRDVRWALQLGTVPAFAWLDGQLGKRSRTLAWAFRGLRLAVAIYACHRNLQEIYRAT